jgi:Ulp1 family protease
MKIEPQQEVNHKQSIKNNNNNAEKNVVNEVVDEAVYTKIDFTSIVKEWRLWHPYYMPAQHNSDDCGIFMLLSMEHITRNAPLNFSQSCIDDVRGCLAQIIAFQRYLPL